MYNTIVQLEVRAVSKEMSVSEVRKHLPALLDEVVEANGEVVITRRGQPIAKITRVEVAEKNRYPLRGLGIWVSDDFDEPMDDLWEALDEP